MIRILFICHGNICRSPMAEFIMKSLAKKYSIDKELYITSKATSMEEIGNDIYPPAKKVLSNNSIPYEKHSASRIVKADLDSFDLIIGMDTYNMQNIRRMLGDSPKIHKLCEYSNTEVDVDDPWYTRDFDQCFGEIYAHCNNLCKRLCKTLANKN